MILPSLIFSIILKFKHFSDLGFDVAFGGYFDIDPKMGEVVAEHRLQTRILDINTGHLGKFS